ncbi:coagulation factor V [Aplochiton taeniatus]
MRLCSWTGVPRLLLVLFLLTVLSHIKANQEKPSERHYYVAAVRVDWSYSGNGQQSSGPTYKKVVFREYDEGFKVAKTHPSWLGLVGPTLKGQEGETLVVTFKNMADRPYSVHPRGIAYGKQSEGALYFDNTSQKEKEDDVVHPNGQHTYYWELTSDVAPQSADPDCLTYTYTSHFDVVKDYNSGLIGTLLVCKPGNLDESGEQIQFDLEYVLLFGVFDESNSWYKPTASSKDSLVKHTINGYTNGSLPDVDVCAHSFVSLHLVGMSSESDLFSVHMNGQVLQHAGHRVSSVGLISGTATTASLNALHSGRWLLSSHTSKHLQAGLHGYVNVQSCEAFEAPKRRLTIQEKRESKEWTFYIAAEEVIWDYAPDMPEYIDEDYRLQYLKQGPQRIGGKYKKAVYTQYEDDTFTVRKGDKQRKKELGILGPVIRAQIRDVIKIVFKNMASRPYSIYPHGVYIEKEEEGASYPAGGNQTQGVQPGETHTYTWNVFVENEPLDGDPRCVTRMYHSAVDTPRDIASGLIGPLLICKGQSLNVRNVQLKADKEQHAMFAVFDENKSWYLDSNIQAYSEPSKVNKEDPDFYKSNVMHSINGYVFESGQRLGFCYGEITTWHVSSVGAQDYIQTATFYGHPFDLNDRTEDYLSLFPMTGETITMIMDNVGFWLLASLNSHESTKGMRVLFSDVDCYRETYEDVNEEELQEKPQTYSEWKPEDLAAIEKEKEREKEKEKTAVVNYVDLVDDNTLEYADLLGLRSLKNQSTDMELLDLSFLDFDAVDMPDGDGDVMRTTNHTHLTENGHVKSVLEPDPLNDTVSPHKLDLEPVVLMNGSKTCTENTTLPNNMSLKESNVSTEAANLNVTTGHGNGTFHIHVNGSTEEQGSVKQPGPNQTAADRVEEFEERLTRGDVFLYIEPLPVESLPHSNSTDEGMQALDTEGPFGPGGGNATDIQEGQSTEERSLPVESSSESRENVSSASFGLVNMTSTESFSHETQVYSSGYGNQSLHTNLVPESSSEELGSLESREKVVIYLRNNLSEGIHARPLDSQRENWGYDGTHQPVPMQMPDHMTKYIRDGPLTTTPGPSPAPTAAPTKKVKRVHHKQRPHKGYGVKTKKKKEFKPQPRTSVAAIQPRGFNPGFSPRGARPQYYGPQQVSSKEDLMNEAIVIGVPRPDFSDYEMYVTGAESMGHQDVLADDTGEDYEYVAYKDPYGSAEDIKKFGLDETAEYYLKMAGKNTKTYFITAEEVEWDYAGYGQRRHEKLDSSSRTTKFKKVVFRGYLDSTFSSPNLRGEKEEHLGILGPVIKAEVGQTIMVFFRNLASRPYSLHPNGVSYTKLAEGLKYVDNSKYWYEYDNEVFPNTTFTYVWKVSEMAGPVGDDSDCRTWAYYSGVNPERDINSGLIGPLLVCRQGTLSQKSIITTEFILLFMTFDESKSWYYQENREKIERKRRSDVMNADFKENLRFHAINGIIFSLKGLRMYNNQQVRWHLFNMGSPKDLHSIHFHGQTFLHKQNVNYRQSVFPLLPGGFATLEMWPSKPGLWQLETEVGVLQQKGMQTLFLVLDNVCQRPLGLESGSIEDSQITSANKRGYWESHLARLNNQGKYNAWSTDTPGSWIQVDFQRPVVISQVATQGAKQLFQSQYVVNYTVSYSTDRKWWIYYKGSSNEARMMFTGNYDANTVVTNTFFPPIIGRFVRLHPIRYYNTATLRMEFYGCELDGCSVPLGMKSGLIENPQITASSTASSWYSGPWQAPLARLDTQGTSNAWQAKFNDMSQWLQVELPQVKKITGIVTQGAKAMGKEMYVTSYILEYSNDGAHWNKYTDEENVAKIFPGNTDNNGHVKNYIYPPIFSRFIRIIPKSWKSTITMRIELLGCDFE